MKVLVVEDTEDSRVFLRDYLSSLGYKVVTASDGLEALDKVADSKPDLIISDILMPRMDGYDFCRKLKTDPSLKSIPFIFYTATYIEEQDKQLALSLGADYFLVKPATPERLSEVINEVLSAETGKEANIIAEDEYKDTHEKVLSIKLDKKVRELKAERELLKRKEQELRLVTDSLPTLIAHVDYDFRYRYVNQTYEEWHQLKRSEIIGHTVEEIVGVDAWKKIEPYAKKAISGEVVEYETEVTFTTGATKSIWVKYIPNILPTGEVDGFISLVNDVTERVRTQMENQRLQKQLLQSQKMDALGQLAGGISHDFNNILASILGYTELAMLQPSATDGKLSQYLQQVMDSGESAKELVSQMLVFSRGGIQQTQNVQLMSVVKSTLSMMGKLLPSSIEIDMIDSEKDYTININLVQLQQIIMNLCINARDSMSGAKGKISLRLEKQHIQDSICASCSRIIKDEFVVLSIKDTGTGMPKENLESIFQPFYSTKDECKGTGMGLSVVHGIVHDYDGHILVKSIPGNGTEFSLLFPEADALSDENKNETNIQAITTRAKINTKILIVDDEEGIVDYLSELLGNEGYQVDAFTDPQQALEYFNTSAERHALVLTDYTMPVMNGIEFSDEIKKINQDVPIILCTGYSDNIDDRLIKEHGIHSYFIKPVVSKELLQKFNEIL